MYRRDLPGDRNRIRHPERRLRNRPARTRSGVLCRPGRALYSAQTVSGPENTHLEHSVFIRPNIGECPTRAGFATKVSRKRSPYRKIAVRPGARKRLPKNLTVTASVSKIPMRSDTYAQNAFGCASPTAPEKPHLSTEILHTTTSCRAPKNLTCAKKWHSKNEISPSPGGLFDEPSRSQVPKSLTFDHFSGKFHSRKASPVAGITACDQGPEKSHLKGIRAGKPGFPSRKASPLGLHRPSRALLLCKMAVVSRKSSHQKPVESRETSPFRKTAQKMGRIGARRRSCKFSPMSAQAENCAVRHRAGSMAVRPRKTSPLVNLVFHCDPESAHDLSRNGSRSSLNPITSAPAEDHLDSRKTSPCRPESLAA